MKKLVFSILAIISFLSVGLVYYFKSSKTDAISSEIVVYQSRICGCCKKWVGHLKDNGFIVRSEFMNDVTDVKLKMNLPMNLASCHTAVVNGYIVEGHVSAKAIKKMISEKPLVKGIAVPSMPIGSPGMEGSHSEAYDVIAFGKNGDEKVFMNF